MIKFNELRITEDGYLIIDVSVREESYYRNIYINNIKIDTQDTFVDAYGASTTGCIYEFTVEEGSNLKHLRKVLRTSDFTTSGIDLNSNLFFVFVTCDGTVTPSGSDCYIPCGADVATTLGTVMASYPYYQ